MPDHSRLETCSLQPWYKAPVQSPCPFVPDHQFNALAALFGYYNGSKNIETGVCTGVCTKGAYGEKIIIKNQKRGCLWFIGIMLLVGIAIAALVYALCIAAGVGLWFLTRYVWRRLVIEVPNSAVVRFGQKLPPIGRKVLAGVACAVVSLCLIGAVSSGTATTEPVEPSIQEQQDGQSPAGAPAEDPEPEEPEPIADDEVVNEFTTDYNEVSASPITEVSDGNIRTKFFGYSYGYYLELLHANDTGKIHVSIAETNKNAEAGVAGMRDVFHDVARTMDPSLSDDEIYAFFDNLLAGGVLTEDQQLGSMLVQFVPDKVLSSGPSRGHIELSAQ